MQPAGLDLNFQVGRIHGAATFIQMIAKDLIQAASQIRVSSRPASHGEHLALVILALAVCLPLDREVLLDRQFGYRYTHPALSLLIMLRLTD